MGQWGFQSLYSTAWALIDCSSNWLLKIDKGETNLTVFLDIKKAFDTIDHEILLIKLNFYGISDTELQFLGLTFATENSAAIITATSRLYKR